jgi:hypothetical protein
MDYYLPPVFFFKDLLCQQVLGHLVELFQLYIWIYMYIYIHEALNFIEIIYFFLLLFILLASIFFL